MIERLGREGDVQPTVVGTRFGLSLGIAQVEVFASAAAKAAVLEAERLAQVAAGLPAGLVHRPARLSELLVTPTTTRAGVQAVLADVADAQAQLHALQAAAISHLASLQPAQTVLPGARDDDPADPDRPDDWVADEVAVVLGIGVGSASVLVDKQRALVEQLPSVWAALADGRIDVRRAQVFVDALAHRKQSFGGGLADDVVDTIAAQGLGWIAEGIGPTPLTDRITGAVIAADPGEADRRAERRKRRQNVTSLGQGDGLAGLRTDLVDAADVAAELDVIDALAASMRNNGDKRPLGQLRVAAHHQLVTRPWQPLPDDVAAVRWQLRMRVDLADLDHLGPLLNPPPDTTEPAPAAAAAAAGPPATDDLTTGDPSQPGPDSASGAACPGPPTDVGPPNPAGTNTSHRSSCSSTNLPDGTPLPGTASPPDAVDRPAGRTQREGNALPNTADLPDAAGLSDGRTQREGSAVPGTAELPDAAGLSDGAGLDGGSGVGSISGLTVSPVAVAELLARYDALLVTSPNGRTQDGEVWFEVVDTTGRLRAITSPAQARAAVRRGTGLAPPPAVDRYSPSAEQIRFVKARDRHCRFPGCTRPAEYADLDHVIPRDHDDPTAGGPTCVTNLVCLCRRHHRLKTHAPGWVFAMEPDGTLHVTPPGGRTRTTRPSCLVEVDMSTPTSTERLTDLLGPTPKRFRSPTPDQRAARRAAADARARLAVEIEAELSAAASRLAAEREADGDDQVDVTGAAEEGAGPEDDPAPF